MIFDWQDNSNKVLETHRLSEGDDWEARRKWTQECALLRHVRHGLGWDEDKARSFWEGISNGLKVAMSYDPAEVDRVWDGLWEASGRLGPLKPLSKGWVTEGDLAFLDSLEAPLWVRRYWLALLIWIRSAKATHGMAEYDGHVNAWLLRQVREVPSMGNAKKTLGRWSVACGRPFPLTTARAGKGAKVVYVLDGRFGGGSVIGEFSPSECASAFSLLERKTFVCRVCGARFDSSRFGKMKLCDSCRIKVRLSANKEAHRKYDEKKRRS